MTGFSAKAFESLPEIRPGDDLAARIAEAAERENHRWAPQSALVVAQKVVSKAEDRFVDLKAVSPSAQARVFAEQSGKDARLVEVVLRQAKRIVRMERGVLIAETHHGWVCANAGVDQSNVDGDRALLLPENPDRSAARLREALEARLGVRLGVIVADSFGRPWRTGQVEVAIGVSGVQPLTDQRGTLDRFDRPLTASLQAVADELAAAAGLLMTKRSGRPAVVLEGAPWDYAPDARAGALQRPPDQDLFR